jgi:maltose/moltooligosaccharide transporter
MGIINMMIVVPMILQTLSFGFIYEKFLGRNPSSAILFAGVLLLLAAIATLRISVKPSTDEEIGLPSSGH